MKQRFTNEELTRLRNKLPVRVVIERLLNIPGKEVEGVYRFLCPHCHEFQTAIHPHENLGRCFRCQKNYNPIDLVIAVKNLNFVSAVKFLLARYQPRFQTEESQTPAIAQRIVDSLRPQLV